MMPGLAELQDLFQRAVVDGDDAVLGHIKPPPRDTESVRLGVYRYAYESRLVEFLEHDFEKLRLLLGTERFARVAHDYVASHPSDQPNARWYSRHLADFLRNDSRYTDDVLTGDLAALELAINDSFDAADAEAVTIDDLAGVPPDSFANVRFRSNPSVRRLAVMTNVADIWPELTAEAGSALVLEVRDTKVELLVWRQSQSSHFRQLSPEEAMAIDAMRDGIPFGVMCEMIAMMDDPDSAAARAAGYLRNWIDSEMIAGIDVE
jgi:hypothetical protein